MTRHHDDYTAPFPVRNLRYLREELAQVERQIPGQWAKLSDLIIRKRALVDAIADAEREITIQTKRSDVD